MTGPGAGRGRLPAAPPVFLERQSYRRRRLLDAARLLPILGCALFAVPLLWPRGPADDAAPVSASAASLYVFSVWAGLIVLAALFGRLARGQEQLDDAAGGEGADARHADAGPEGIRVGGGG